MECYGVVYHWKTWKNQKSGNYIKISELHGFWTRTGNRYGSMDSLIRELYNKPKITLNS